MYSSYKGANYSLPLVADNSSNYVVATGIRVKF
jgi:hypothetical protein